MHFTSSKKPKKTLMSLLRVKQKDREILKDYILRFNIESLEIVNLTMMDTANALIKGLKASPLQLTFLKKTLKHMTDLLSSREVYQLEETLKFGTSIEVTPSTNQVTNGIIRGKKKMTNLLN